LSLKQKGRGIRFTPLPMQKFKELVNFAFDNNISIGFDSCTSTKFVSSIQDRDPYPKHVEQCVEPCESGLFSIYINYKCEAFPCSFMEGEPGWESGINVLDCDDFVKDVWFSEKLVEWRNNLLECKRNCPRFTI